MILFHIILSTNFVLLASANAIAIGPDEESELKKALGACSGENCVCSVFGTWDYRRWDLVYECPLFQPKMYLGQWVYGRLNISIDKFDELGFTCCRFPLGQSLANYPHDDITRDVVALNIDSNGANFNVTIGAEHFEGFDSLRDFKLKGLKDEFSVIHNDSFEGVIRLERIKIEVPNIHLPIGLFNKLKNLNHLNLSGNNFKRLESGLLLNQKNLKLLDLGGNNIDSLRSNSFEGLIALEQLILSSNNLKTFNADIFHHLKSLTNIDLSANEISEFPSGLFANNTKLTAFKMVDNRESLKTLPNDLFDYLVDLRTIEIGCGLRRIPESIFFGSYKIEKIILHNNMLQVLPRNLFKDQKNLEKLDLSKNAFKILDDKILLNNKNLKELHLSDNRLTKLSTTLFNSVDNLLKLYLSGNQISPLDPIVLKRLSSIEELDLSDNGLNSLAADAFYSFTNLIDINLSGNRFPTLPVGLFSSNKNLRNVRIAKNLGAVKTLPKTFLADLNFLENVAIEIGLQEIPESTFFNSPNIFNISLQNNDLDSLPVKLLVNNSKLRELNLSGNKISHLDAKFFINSKYLEKLHLSRNRLKTVPVLLFEFIDRLAELHLDSNRITSEIWLVFDQIKTAMNKNQTNPLQPFSLSVLDLSDNFITELSTRNLELPDVVILTVNLTRNRITNIDVQPISLLENSVKVNLKSNPLLCDCSIYNFVAFIVTGKYDKGIHFKIGSMECAGPDKLKGKKFSDLISENLTCLLDREEKTSMCPEKCECIAVAEDRSLTIECGTNVNFEQQLNISRDGFNRIELNIEGTFMRSLPNRASSWYNQTTILHASGNEISEIGVENIPYFIQTLELNNNKLSTFDQAVIDFINNSTLQNMKLAENLWNCSCENLEFISFVFAKHSLISDFDKMKCFNGIPFQDINIAEICSNPFIFLISCIVGVGFILSALAALFYRYEKQIKMWMYSHNFCLWLVSEEELDKEKVYDAFVSYSSKDCEFVTEQLIPKLESLNYVLCVHERDWMPGVEITTQISNSVNDAKRTIIVMSPNFLQSNWATWEFRVAQSHAATENRSRIIVILFGDIGDINKLDPDLRDYLKLNTHVKWGDKWFWEKLKYALPHRKNGTLSETESLEVLYDED